MDYQTNKFALHIPDDWQDRSIITYAANYSPGEFSPNVVVTREPVPIDTSIEDYANFQFSITQAEVQGLQIINRENTMISGRPAVQIVQTIAAHGLSLQQLQTFVLSDEIIYVITCTATAATFEQYISQFQKIAQSFKLNDA